MKSQEVKLKLITSVNRLIDTYFGSPVMSEKMINATLKVLVKQNAYKLDNILSLFADANGEINPQDILKFSWDNEATNKENKNTYISKQDIERLKAKANKIIQDKQNTKE